MNTSPAPYRNRHPRRNGFTVASLLLLTAAAAIFFASVATGVKGLDGRDPSFMVGTAFAGLVVGAVVGLMIGIGQVRRMRGVFLGLGSGAIGGAMAGMLVATPQAWLTMIVGAVILVAFASVVSYFSKAKPPE